MSDTLMTLLPVIESASRAVAREYPGVDSDDVYQSLCVWVLENASYLKTDEVAGCRYILYRAAHIIARKERTEALQSCVQYDYTPADVRKILETAFDDSETWLKAHVPADGASLKATGMDGIEVTLDIRAAVAELGEGDASAIFSRYADGIVPEAGSAERKRLDRAVHKLTELVNTYSVSQAEALAMRGHPGSRRAMSNAAAQALIGRGTDG
ncbi:hypothetical protein [Dactylosporangium sp. CA-139066]|uniref:hypothetical protein n=1 Tax=Dactylosporangium sp. CA-139066 TaxID=3239930 RepID=UPI003D89FF39